MKNTQVGGTKKKAVNMLSMTGLILIFLAYMFPFIMVVINSLKQKRDIIKQCHLDKDNIAVRILFTASKHFVYSLFFYI